MANSHRHTIYDVMESKGVFQTNPANIGAKTIDGQPLYKGPQEYPKMLYHPKGETKVTVQPTAEATPFGPEMRGEQREIINVTVADAAEERKFRASGWHTHPAHAISASGGVAPPISSDERIAELEARIAELQKEHAQARAEPKTAGTAKA